MRLETPQFKQGNATIYQKSMKTSMMKSNMTVKMPGFHDMNNNNDDELDYYN